MTAGAHRTILVTGASGFLGRQLVVELARRGDARVWALARGPALEELSAWLQERVPAPSVEVLEADIRREYCGLADRLRELCAEAGVEIFHCAARYDLVADDPEADEATNVEGTRRVLELAEHVGARRFHHMSTVAVAGDFHGVWTEAHHAEATSWRSNYARTKHRAERCVRESGLAGRAVYRLGVLVGDTPTGSVHKPDGIYRFFDIVERAAATVPRGVPLPTFGWGALPLCPVDHAVRALVALARAEPDEPEQCPTWHVFEDRVLRADAVLEVLLRAAGRDEVVPLGWVGHAVQWFDDQARHDGALANLKGDFLEALERLDVPAELLGEFFHPTQYSNAATAARLRALGIASTDFTDYAPRIWHGWLAERAVANSRRREDFFTGRTVLVTGGTSGVGRGVVDKLVRRGAHVVLLARDEDKVEQLRATLPAEQRGRLGFIACDLCDDASVARAIAAIRARGTEISVFIHSAGLSIHKPLVAMSEELDEVDRMTQVNFLAPLRILRALLPEMAARPDTRIVLASSISVQLDVPGFAAYSATKLALDQAARAAVAEMEGHRLSVVSVRLPLVRTAMTQINPRLRQVPMLSANTAAERVLDATVAGDVVSGTRIGWWAELLRMTHPRLGSVVTRFGWRTFQRVPYFTRLAVAEMTSHDR